MKSDFPRGMWQRIWSGFASHQAWKANCKALCFFLVWGRKPSGRNTSHILLMSFVNVTNRDGVYTSTVYRSYLQCRENHTLRRSFQENALPFKLYNARF